MKKKGARMTDSKRMAFRNLKRKEKRTRNESMV